MSEPQLTISREKFGAVISGLEGVVTQTAKLHAAAWKRLFDARIDGAEAKRLELDGRPDPDTFWEASRRMGIPPERTRVLDDTAVGVAAGKRGRFGLVVGVNRAGQGQFLRSHGADVVLGDLCSVDVDGDDP